MATTSWDLMSLSVETETPAWDVLQAVPDVTEYVEPAWDVLQVSGAVQQQVRITASSGTPETLETVTLTAASVGPSDFDTWTWQVAAGSVSVGLTGTGVTRSFVAPALENGGTVTVTVRASKGATQSAVGSISVTIPPHTLWIAGSSSWLPQLDVVPL